MSEPFVGEIRMAGFNFAPRGWAQCNGQILSISQNTALFSLLGTNYGGNGTTNFALPDLRGRTPIQQGQGPGLSVYALGQVSGVESVTLIGSEIPAHTHPLHCDSLGGRKSTPVNNFAAIDGLAASKPYATATDGTTLNAATLGSFGGSQPHENRMPLLVMNFIIALFGIFPARN